MTVSEARAEARRIAQEITDGTLPPYDGAIRIWKEILDLLDGKIPDDLWPFKSNASAIEDCLWNAEESGTNHEELIEQCKREIQDAAKALLATA